MMHEQPVGAESVSDYLELPDTRIELLTELDKKIGEPMDPECICSIVAPAYNEAKNIEAFLDALNKQTFSTEADLEPENFEVIVVVNNTTDETADIARSWIESTKQGGNLRFKFHIVEVTFDEKDRGVGSARKTGADLALLRSLNRESDTDEYYLVGLDSDNSGIPQDHLEKYILGFRKGASVLAGTTDYDLKDFPQDTPALKQIKDLLDFATAWKKESNFVEVPEITSGFNHGVTRELYARIGGYPRTRVGEDVYIGKASEKIGYPIGEVQSPIRINPRRLIAAGAFDFFTGAVWEKDRFVALDDAVREGQMSSEPIDNLGLRKVMSKGLCSQASALSKRTNTPFNVAYSSLKKSLIAFYQERYSEELPDWIPDETLFDIENSKAFLQGRNIPENEKDKLQNNSLYEAASLTQETSAVLSDETAAAIYDETVVPTFAVNISIPEQDIGMLAEAATNHGLTLFSIERELNTFFLQVANDREDFTTSDGLVLLSVDENGIPMLRDGELSPISVHLIDKKPKAVQLQLDEDAMSIAVLPTKEFVILSLAADEKTQKIAEEMYERTTTTEKAATIELARARNQEYNTQIIENVTQIREHAQGLEQEYLQMLNEIANYKGIEPVQQRRLQFAKLLVDEMGNDDWEERLSSLIVQITTPDFVQRSTEYAELTA